MIKFIKHQEETEKTKATVFLPLHSCNILSFSHMVSKVEKEGEVTELEVLHIEESILEEHTYNVPLKKLRKIKQSKTEEIFDASEVVKVMEPRIKSFKDKFEIDRILAFLNENSI